MQMFANYDTQITLMKSLHTDQITVLTWYLIISYVLTKNDFEKHLKVFVHLAFTNDVQKVKSQENIQFCSIFNLTIKLTRPQFHSCGCKRMKLSTYVAFTKVLTELYNNYKALQLKEIQVPQRQYQFINQTAIKISKKRDIIAKQNG